MVDISLLFFNGVSALDIYQVSELKIPSGYKFVAFREPELREQFLPLHFHKFNNYIGKCIIKEYFKDKPRIIVKKLNTIMTPYKNRFTKTWTIKEIYGMEDPVIPEGYEAIEFRLVKSGEDYLIQSGTKDLWDLECPSAKPFLILHKQKKFYAKIPLISFTREEASTYVQFKDVADVYWRINLNKDVEIVEE